VSVPFRERNPVTIGAISLAVMAMLVLAAFKADHLPLIGGGDTYYASFSEAGGIKPNDEVRVAGVRVGKVKAVDLDGDHVKVEFLIDSGTEFGTQTGAQIKVKTLLGQMFLSLEPDGSGQLAEGSTIPTSRTKSPYDVVKVMSLPASVFWNAEMTGSLAVLRTEKPTMLSLSSEPELPLDAAQPDRMAGTARAAAVSAMSLFRWIMV